MGDAILDFFGNIEDIFRRCKGSGNGYLDALVTLFTAVGALYVLFHFIKLTFEIIQGFRLYVWSQISCCNTDLKKYGTWAVISGSTDGIGLSMARELARRGHSIIVIGRNEEKLSRTKVSLEEEPNAGEIMTVKIDLSDSSLENYNRIKDQIDAGNRDIGILINNAGTFPGVYQRYNNNDLSYLRDIVNVNVLATVYLTRMIMPGMLDRGRGLIINVSSMLGEIPAPYMSIYGPTKSFIDSFSGILKAEYSNHPIDIINLTAGAVHTKLFTATAKIPKPSLVNPSPDDYAKSALNAASTRIGSYCGTLVHGLSFKIFQYLNYFGLIPSVFRLNMKIFIKDARLSPVTRRKTKTSVVEPYDDALFTTDFRNQFKLIQQSLTDVAIKEASGEISRAVATTSSGGNENERRGEFKNKSKKFRYDESEESSIAIPTLNPSSFPKMGNEVEARTSMLMSWYMAGYHTGYHTAMKK